MLRDAWALAIDALCRIETRGLSERLALVKASKRLGMQSSSAMGLAHKLVLETVRRQNFLDHLVDFILTPRAINELRPQVRAFLRLYAYVIKVQQKEGYGKAVNIANIGRALLGWWRLKDVEDALGLLLGVNHEKALTGLDDVTYIALQRFQPVWFVKYCFKLLGRHRALRYLESTGVPTPTYIRINSLKIADEGEVLRQLGRSGITLERVEELKYTFEVVEKQQPLVRTSSFQKGEFFIQDKASCLAGEVAAPEPGMTVLDVCAAPGAKTTYLAQLMKNRGTIYSVDYSRRRIRVWQRELARMGVEIGIPLISDAYNPLPLHDVKADLVLLDPPCTSTGTFSRTPSAKWRFSRRSVRHMATIQWHMLNSCAPFVDQGGSLVYSTCSITIEENEVLIERFLKWNPEFTLVETKPRIGLPGLRGQTASQRLYPHLHECNGFFIAKLEKPA